MTTEKPGTAMKAVITKAMTKQRKVKAAAVRKAKRPDEVAASAYATQRELRQAFYARHPELDTIEEER